MAGSISIDRTRWLGYRWRQHGLGGQATKDLLDDLLLLGVQDSRHGGARQSLIQRTSRIGSTGVARAIAPDGPLVTFWSVRGAPHAHRSTQLDVVRDALAPRDSDDGGTAFVAAVQTVASALRAVVTAPLSKAEASSAVSARVPGDLVTHCASCGTNHIPDGLFRAAGRQAQVVLGPEDQRATMLHPSPGGPQQTVDLPRQALLQAYLRVNGPTTKPLYRDWSGGGTPGTAELWTELDDLVRVQIDGRRYDLPEALVDRVMTAPEPHGVVLVPPHDAYLRQVDRTLLVPDRVRRAEVWRALSAPGALLVDGEVAGTWRYRRNRNELTITAFEGLAAPQRAQAENSAARIASATGDVDPAVGWS